MSYLDNIGGCHKDIDGKCDLKYYEPRFKRHLLRLADF